MDLAEVLGKARESFSPNLPGLLGYTEVPELVPGKLLRTYSHGAFCLIAFYLSIVFVNASEGSNLTCRGGNSPSWHLLSRCACMCSCSSSPAQPEQYSTRLVILLHLWFMCGEFLHLILGSKMIKVMNFVDLGNGHGVSHSFWAESFDGVRRASRGGHDCRD